jgi:hypothetical protein
MIFVHEKCPITVLKCIVAFLQKFRNLFECIWYPNVRVIKQIIKQKIRKRNSTQKREEEGTSPNWAVPGAQNQPEQASARTPLSLLFFLFLFLFLFTPTGRPHLSAPPSTFSRYSFTGNRRRRDSRPGFNACPFLPRVCAYKMPSVPSPFPLFLPYPRCRQASQIARRSSPFPRIGTPKSCEFRPPLRPSLVPSSLPCTGASSNALKLVVCTGKPSIRSSPRTTAAATASSRPSPPRLDAVKEADHTIEFLSTS